MIRALKHLSIRNNYYSMYELKSASTKTRPGGVKRPPPYFIKRKRPRLFRPRKNPPEPWPMSTAKGIFFTPTLPPENLPQRESNPPGGRYSALLASRPAGRSHDPFEYVGERNGGRNDAKLAGQLFGNPIASLSPQFAGQHDAALVYMWMHVSITICAIKWNDILSS